jgi:hypothetical protein
LFNAVLAATVPAESLPADSLPTDGIPQEAASVEVKEEPPAPVKKTKKK